MLLFTPFMRQAYIFYQTCVEFLGKTEYITNAKLNK